ncbi:metalloprotease [Candidatus Woesearchaeota archaeon]|nr:metalloprotease [Candidatus Woesearchaeota archaeon]
MGGSKSNQIQLLGISTSETELKDILKAWLAISAAFGIIMSGSLVSAGFYSKFVIASLTVGIGFLLHELGHKLVAQKYGCFAEFRSFDGMLVLAVAMSFLGVVFAAPGAVMIEGKVSRRKSGWISAAGPIVNLLLAAAFFGMSFAGLGTLRAVAYYGFIINSWLALFNMIPFWLFDGHKILKWSKTAYFAIAATAAMFMLLQNFITLA